MTVPRGVSSCCISSVPFSCYLREKVVDIRTVSAWACCVMKVVHWPRKLASGLTPAYHSAAFGSYCSLDASISSLILLPYHVLCLLLVRAQLTYLLGLTHSTPLPTFLRTPLTAIQSTTYAFYPDETHSSIRRVFSPSHAPHTKRHFCGYCGTQLSFWREDMSDANAAEWVFVNLGAIGGEGLDTLDAWGILGSLDQDDEDDEEAERTADMEDDTALVSASTRRGPDGRVVRTRAQGAREVRGQPWFEEVIEGTRLGRIKRSRGGQTNADGRGHVEWSVVEYEEGTGDEDEGEDGELQVPNGNGKRKAGEMSAGESEDVHMRG